MILNINTKDFQDLLSKVIKGVSNNKLFPITSLVGIQVMENELTVMAYDGNNSVYLFYPLKEDVQGEAYVAVEANRLNDLVSKLTDETVQLIFDDNSFNIKSSNGTFKFNVAVEEGFGVVQFPDNQSYLLKEAITYFQLPYKELEVLLTVNKSAAAKTSEVICLTGAYISDKIITTDSYVACITDKELFKDKLLLLNYTTIDLLGVFEKEDNIVAIIGENRVCFYTDNALIVGSKMTQLNDFPGEEIKSFLDLQFTNECLVKKSEILNALDRLNIFITPFDKNIMELSFTENSLTIKSLNSNAVESIPIKNGSNLVCKTGFSGLKNEISSIIDDVFTLKFGNEIALAVVDKTATHIISLAKDV